MYQSFEDQEHGEFLNRRVAAEESAYSAFLQSHPEISPVMANRKLIWEYLGATEDDKTQGRTLITLQLLEDALPFVQGSLALRDFAADQRALLDEAVELLASWSDAGAQDRLNQLARMPWAQLRNEVRNLRDAARLKTLSRTELRQATREEYAAAHPQLVGGYPTLPKDFPRIGSLSPAQIREAARQFGWAQLNARQRGEN
jgi:hypothetical protein